MSEIHGYYFIIEFLFLKDIRVVAIFSHFSNVKTTDTKRGCGFTSTFIKWLCKHTRFHTSPHVSVRCCVQPSLAVFQDKAETTEKGVGVWIALH